MSFVFNGASVSEPTPPTPSERILAQILAPIIIVFLPILWIGLILYLLGRILLGKTNACDSDAIPILGMITIEPFLITLENLIYLASCCDEEMALPFNPNRSWGDPEGGRSRRPYNRSETSASSSPSSQEPYKSCPLKGDDQFRLFIIYPGSYDDPLRGELVTTRFSDNRRPLYDALSYTWADDSGDSTRSIELSIEKPRATIRITKNCELAMRRLRKPDETRTVWIDTICIDQGSNTERTYQVSLMSRIYTSAHGVVVYTGEATARSDMLFDWLNGLKAGELPAPLRLDLYRIAGDIASNLEIYWNIGKERVSALSGNSNTKDQTQLTEPELVELVTEFLSRRWFRRVWVLQEVVLPDPRNTVVICGAKSTPAMRALYLVNLLKDHPSGSMVRIFSLVRKKTEGTNSHLLDVLIETRDREVGDPRDKIFGVLSISTALDRGMFPNLAADYDKRTTEVYTKYSEFFIQHHGPGFFFSLMKSPSKLAGLPSWAADWTVPWPNPKAVQGKDFAATSRTVCDEDGGAVFTDEGRCRVLTLTRPRILRGYFTREGHLDDSSGMNIKRVEDLKENEVLIEMYRGLAALLQKDDVSGYYTLIQTCPHALVELSLIEIVDRWSSVVFDLKVPESDALTGPSDEGYLSEVEIFKIR
ncbi:HET-domain-containing protein [Daldinia eschscholtzii]|nr:HET-domain-containing protein [Daldinia eschscholtzii]